MKKLSVLKTLSFLGLGIAAQGLSAGNITDINVSTLPNNQKIVKIKFDKDVVRPNNAPVGSPTQIVLDFPTTGVALPQPVLEYADPLLSQIAATQNNNQARILLALNKAGRANAEVKGNEVWIYLNEAAGASSPQIHQSGSRQSANAGATVDFRKGNNTTGIVELSVPGFRGTPDVKQQADRVIVTLKNYPLPIQAQRNLDVSDFSTPVRSVVMKRLGNDTQIVIRNQGSWSVNTKNAAGRMSFEIAQKSSLEADGLKNKPKNYRGNKVSLDFQDVEVRTILQILAKESGMNIVASDSVNGKMTISLKDVPWDQALDFVLEARNLDKRQNGNIINVAPSSELLEKDKAKLIGQKELAELGPLVSQTFQLKYKDVQEFRKILNLNENGSRTRDENSILSSRGSVLIDAATNTLIVTDNPAIIQKFQKVIDQLDVPARQVMVEARIVEAQDGFSRALGVKFGYAGSNGKNSWGNNWSNAVANADAQSKANRNMLNWSMNPTNTLPEPATFTLGPNISLPISATATGTIALVHNFASGALGLELAAQQAQNKVKIVSSPRVLTQDRKEAVIESGTEIPYQEAASSGATSTSFKKAVLGLTVTPNITPDGQVIMDIKVNKDSVDRSCGASEPCISTQRLDTKAMVEDGGTLILGGIFQETNTDKTTKVPLLGDIPVVGNLFKSRERENSRNELLIFITPRIVDNVGSSLRY
ncbi:MAG: type IV pilus secretin PilQ family protein [Neisseria sp.]|nr:type IV pilus secretin PilQ family protein [Neisseria sp.]